MKLVRILSLLVIATSASLGAAGCGDSEGPKSAKVVPGPMPEGESWTGVYFHPLYGHLHLQEEGSNVVGRWKRTDHSKWGEMSGTQQGNVFHYAWKEHTVGMVGPSATTSGKGYFVYKMNKDGIGELHGEFGMKNSEVGYDWKNVKQQRMQPDLKSIGGDAEGVAPGQL
jgi:hypothetical protein